MIKLPSHRHCPKCGTIGRRGYTRSRLHFRRRRFQCPKCEHIWSTFETVLDPRRLRVRVVPGRTVITKPRLKP